MIKISFVPFFLLSYLFTLEQTRSRRVVNAIRAGRLEGQVKIFIIYVRELQLDEVCVGKIRKYALHLRSLIVEEKRALILMTFDIE